METSVPFSSTHASLQVVPETTNYARKVILLILVFFAIKFFCASTLELGNDEAYYWVYSEYLQWNYFDHPPMVGVWIRLFTFNLLLQDHEGFVRLGAVIGSAIATWFIFKAVATIHSARAGWYAACLYNASFYAGITAGLYILPDAPQMVFWTFSLWMIARILKDEKNWINWILLGISAGLCIMSKVHGVFLWFGMGLYILLYKRKWFANPRVYIAFILSLVIISPIFFWNLKYDFITYRFHSERVDIESYSIKIMGFVRELGNQLSLNNPFNTGLMIAGFITWRRKNLSRFKALTVYNLIGLPLAVVLLVISLFRNTVLPHWSGPAYVTLVPLSAIKLAEMSFDFLPKLLRFSLLTFLLGLAGLWLVIHFLPGTYGRKDDNNFGRSDLTLDMYGWTEAGKQFDSLYKSDVARGLMPKEAAIVSATWGVGAHAEYYFGLPSGLTMICLADPLEIHQYYWVNRSRINKVRLDTVYCVSSSTKSFYVPTNFYQKTELATIIQISRSGKPAHRFYIFRLRGLKKAVPMVGKSVEVFKGVKV